MPGRSSGRGSRSRGSASRGFRVPRGTGGRAFRCSCSGGWEPSRWVGRRRPPEAPSSSSWPPGVVAGLIPWALTGWETGEVGSALAGPPAVRSLWRPESPFSSRHSCASSERVEALRPRLHRPSASSWAAPTATCATRCTSQWARRSSGRRCSSAARSFLFYAARSASPSSPSSGWSRSRRSRAATAPGTTRTAAPSPGGVLVARRGRGIDVLRRQEEARSGGRVRRVPERDLRGRP